MDLALSPELEQFIQDEVASGRYQTAGEVVQEALQILKERGELGPRNLEELKSEIRIGLEQLDRGQATVYDDPSLTELFERIKARGREKLARRAQEHSP